jgi:hypothetical protein
MLLGSEQEWEISYHAAAKEHLAGDAKKVSFLNNIHENPQYYNDMPVGIFGKFEATLCSILVQPQQN